MNTISKRLLRCLRRVEQHKSKPDLDAVFMLEERGLISITGPSDDLAIEITDAGRVALAEAKPK